MTAPDHSGYEFLSHEDVPEALASVAEFDEVQNGFFEDCAAYTHKPNRAAALAVANSATLLVDAYRSSVESIVSSDAAVEEKALQIKTLLIEDDKKRMTVFNDLTQTETFSPFNKSSHETLGESLLSVFEESEDDDIVEGMAKSYAMDLENEVADFLTCLVSLRSGERFTKKAVVQIIGKNALDIGKIGAGVALGILASKGYISHH